MFQTTNQSKMFFPMKIPLFELGSFVGGPDDQKGHLFVDLSNTLLELSHCLATLMLTQKMVNCLGHIMVTRGNRCNSILLKALVHHA